MLIIKKRIRWNNDQTLHIRLEPCKVTYITCDDEAIMQPSRPSDQSVVLLMLSGSDFCNPSFRLRLLTAKHIADEFRTFEPVGCSWGQQLVHCPERRFPR